MKSIICSLFVTIMVFTHVDARDIYVAKNGNDSNPGSITEPYLTISKASTEAMPGDRVYIREGSYEEVLRPARSGANGNPIVFEGYQNEKVVITAMEALSGFTPDQGSIYKTTVAWDMGQQNFVMHQQTALDLARWPNNTDGDPYTMDSRRNDGGSGSNEINAHLTDNSGLGTDVNGSPIDWSQGGSIHFYGDRPGSGWICWRAFITASSSTRVDFQLDKNPSWIRTFHEPSGKGEYFLQGVKQALDYQNEWYFDPATKTLYLQIPGGSQPVDGDVQMRRRELTIDLDNKSDIKIKNLAVFGGEIIINGNRNELEGVTSLYGNHTLGVVNNSFSSGNQSVDIRGNDNVINRCNIGHGAGSGVADRANRTQITNSYIHGFNTLGSYDAILNTRGGDGGKYFNNVITRGGRDAIQGSSVNSEYAYNDVSYSNLMADDCALFYVVGGPKNSELHHNWFHDAYSHGSKRKAAGVYLDNDAHSFSVHHNVIWNTEWTAFQINWDGTNLDIFNNTVFNNQSPMGAWHKAGTQFYDVRVWNNLADKDGSNAGGQESESTWEPQADKQNNLVDPNGFSDPAQYDFTLTAGALAIDHGRQINEPKFGIGAAFNYTDGFVGSAPDAGAYEFGKPNWVAGTDWDIEDGAIGVCYGLPGEECSGIINNPIVESIGFVSDPGTVVTASSYSFDVDYAANEERDIIVEIKTATDGWVGRNRTTVQRGTGVITSTVSLNAPLAAAAGYKLTAWLVPVGLDWQDIIVSQNRTFDVIEPIVEAVELINTPLEIEVTNSYTFEFSYAAAEARDVIVEIKNNANQWLSNKRVSVPQGTGMASGTVDFNSDLLIADGYKLAAFMVPVGMDWQSIIVDDNALFDVVLVTGIDEEIVGSGVYPNPTRGRVMIDGGAQVSVFNSLGDKVLSEKTDEIDLSHQPAGIYLIFMDGKSYRILKQ